MVTEADRATDVANLRRLADSSGALRRHVSTADELYDLIAPATPDRVLFLDEGGSIFQATWWTGNEDARRVASEDAASMLASPHVVPLTGYTEAEEFVGFSFYLTLPKEMINEA